MQSKLWMESIVRVINELGGYFTFASGEEEFVVVRKAEFEELKSRASETQLGLPDFDDRGASVRGGREVGEREDAPPSVYEDSYQGPDFGGAELAGGATVVTDEPQSLPLDHTSLADELSGGSEFAPPAVENKVRFEPLRGDIAPDLQE